MAACIDGSVNPAVGTTKVVGKVDKSWGGGGTS